MPLRTSIVVDRAIRNTQGCALSYLGKVDTFATLVKR